MTYRSITPLVYRGDYVKEQNDAVFNENFLSEGGNKVLEKQRIK